MAYVTIFARDLARVVLHDEDGAPFATLHGAQDEPFVSVAAGR